MSDEKSQSTPVEAEKPPVSALAKWRRRAVLAGIVLAIVCKFLPVDYRGPCQAVVSLCTGAF